MWMAEAVIQRSFALHEPLPLRLGRQHPALAERLLGHQQLPDDPRSLSASGISSWDLRGEVTQHASFEQIADSGARVERHPRSGELAAQLGDRVLQQLGERLRRSCIES